MSNDALPAKAKDFPPAAKHIYDRLDGAGDDGLTQSTLAAKLYYHEDTVRLSLNRLEAADLVESEFHPSDGRKTLYRTTGTDS